MSNATLTYTFQMVDYIGLILTAVCTGIGVTLGQEIYNWLKERRSSLKSRLRRIADENKRIF